MNAVREAQAEDCAYIAARLRIEDAAECALIQEAEGEPFDPLAALCESYALSSRALTLTVDGEPAAMLGVAESAYHDAAAIWLLGTPALDAHSVWFARTTKALLPVLAAPYRVVFNVVDRRYARALSWLAWLGFRPVERVAGGPVPPPSDLLVGMVLEVSSLGQSRKGNLRPDLRRRRRVAGPVRNGHAEDPAAHQAAHA